MLDQARWALVEQSCGARAVVELQRLREASEAALGRLEALEADVRFLCTELGAEKLLWSSRFLELLREQQGLRQRVSAPRGGSPGPWAPPATRALSQLQEHPLQWDSPELPGDVEEPNASGSEGEGPAGMSGDSRSWRQCLGQNKAPPQCGCHPKTSSVPVCCSWPLRWWLGTAASLARCSHSASSPLCSVKGRQWMEQP